MNSRLIQEIDGLLSAMEVRSIKPVSHQVQFDGNDAHIRMNFESETPSAGQKQVIVKLVDSAKSWGDNRRMMSVIGDQKLSGGIMFEVLVEDLPMSKLMEIQDLLMIIRAHKQATVKVFCTASGTMPKTVALDGVAVEGSYKYTLGHGIQISQFGH